MKQPASFTWFGERNRPMDVYRPCPCGICSKNRRGVGYLSFSDGEGHGFTVWIEKESVFERLKHALRQRRAQRSTLTIQSKRKRDIRKRAVN